MSIRIAKGALPERARLALKKANPNSLSLVELTIDDLAREAVQMRDHW